MEESEAEKKAGKDYLKIWQGIDERKYKVFREVLQTILDCAYGGVSEAAQVNLTIAIAASRVADDMLNQSPQRDVIRAIAGHLRIWPILINGVDKAESKEKIQRVFRLLHLGKNQPYKVSEDSTFKTDRLGERTLGLVDRVKETGWLYTLYNRPDCLFEPSLADKLPKYRKIAGKIWDKDIIDDSFEDWWYCVRLEFDANYGNLSGEELVDFAIKLWPNRTPSRAYTEIGWIRQRVKDKLRSLVKRKTAPKKPRKRPPKKK